MTSNYKSIAIRFAVAAVFAVLVVVTPVAANVVEVESATSVTQPISVLDLAVDLDGSAEACLNFTPAEPAPEPVATAAVQAKPCKPCRERPTCECSYNGMPRISCVPCCYRNQFTGQQVCFD